MSYSAPIGAAEAAFASIRTLLELHLRTIDERAQALRANPGEPLRKTGRMLCVSTLLGILSAHVSKLAEWLLGHGPHTDESVLMLDMLDGRVITVRRNTARTTRGQPACPAVLDGHIYAALGRALRIDGHGRARGRAHRDSLGGRGHTVRRYADHVIYCDMHCTSAELGDIAPGPDGCWVSFFFSIPTLERRRAVDRRRAVERRSALRAAIAAGVIVPGGPADA